MLSQGLRPRPAFWYQDCPLVQSYLHFLTCLFIQSQNTTFVTFCPSNRHRHKSHSKPINWFITRFLYYPTRANLFSYIAVRVLQDPLRFDNVTVFFWPGTISMLCESSGDESLCHLSPCLSNIKHTVYYWSFKYISVVAGTSLLFPACLEFIYPPQSCAAILHL